MNHVSAFLNYLSKVKNYSAHTLLSYKTDLVQFNDYCIIVYGLASIDHAEYAAIRLWIVQLVEQGLSSRSVNRKISSLKSYYRFLLKEGIIDFNPVDKITSLKTNKVLPQFVKEKEMDLLLDEIDFGEGFEAFRDKLIIELFYSTGIRLNELITLKTSMIDFNIHTIRVIGKRNKERIIPITAYLADLINQFIKCREEVVDFESNDREYLFLNKKGKRIYPKLVYRIVKSHLNQVSSLSKRSPHILRHSFATHMLNKGADLNAIKEILGHANLSATEIYTHNSFEKLKSIYKQAHPRA